MIKKNKRVYFRPLSKFAKNKKELVGDGKDLVFEEIECTQVERVIMRFGGTGPLSLALLAFEEDSGIKTGRDVQSINLWKKNGLLPSLIAIHIKEIARFDGVLLNAIDLEVGKQKVIITHYSEEGWKKKTFGGDLNEEEWKRKKMKFLNNRKYAHKRNS